ncbi:MAG: HNH endonuclease signature motif containing protein, partial [Microbacteriaceae bacterium]
GCASCGLDIAYTEAHHIAWWKRDDGPSDLSNGVMLCPPCHTRIHNDGWMVTIRSDGQPWFTPPRFVDPDQKPRLGGKARYALPDLDTA